MTKMTQIQIAECRSVIIDTMTAKGRPMRPCEFRAALKDAGYDIEARTIESMLRTMAKQQANEGDNHSSRTSAQIAMMAAEELLDAVKDRVTQLEEIWTGDV